MFPKLLGTFVSPQGCQDDCGEEGQPGGVGMSREALHPSSSDVCRISDAVVPETERDFWLILLSSLVRSSSSCSHSSR